jgi:glycosyltransferase involved in cell wall biosynthesis
VKVLLVNQTFHPDVASSGQHLRDLALGLVEKGHQVTVVTSRRAYDQPQNKFPKSEWWRGIRILRVSSTGFGKASRWRRAVDFASFSAACGFRMAFLARHDVIVALTSPPLISFLAAWLAKLRRCRFIYWIMDFNPDEAVAAGWLRAGSLPERLLDSMSRFSLRTADGTVALDHFMRDRILSKGVATEKVTVLPPWSHDTEVKFDPNGREKFRTTNGLKDSFVVMYSGNHSPCHPLDTLLQAAARLRSDPSISFLFVGGGSEFRKIQKMSESASGAIKPNIRCLGYRPLEELSGSLSAADLHVIVMGDEFVGLVHPCKIYNILNVAAPVLYIGPASSHITEVLGTLRGEHRWAAIRHQDVDGAVEAIRLMKAESAKASPRMTSPIIANFALDQLLPRFIALIEGVSEADVKIKPIVVSRAVRVE